VNKEQFIMPNIFLDRTEGRLRSFWRVLFQALIFILLMVLGQILAGIVIGVLAVANGIPISDPEAISALTVRNTWVNAIVALLALGSMFFSYWVGTKMDRRKFVDYGFRFSKTWWADFGFGLFLGAILMVFIFGVELSAGWITITGTMTGLAEGTFWPGILAALVNFFCVGIYEEMLSRGYQIHNLAEGFRGRILNPKMALLLAYLLTSSIFGFLHASNPNATLTSSVMLIAAGLFLGLGYVLTGDLAISIGIHMTWNFFQGNVFGFPVSGTEAGSSIIGIQQGGPVLWTGGAFGPESGLIGLAAIALGCLLILAWIKLTRKNIRLQEELAIFTPPASAIPTVVIEPIPPAEGLPTDPIV
jgi:membrane protease YdiL (CAAX protease family)